MNFLMILKMVEYVKESKFLLKSRLLHNIIHLIREEQEEKCCQRNQERENGMLGR